MEEFKKNLNLLGKEVNLKYWEHGGGKGIIVGLVYELNDHFCFLVRHKTFAQNGIVQGFFHRQEFDVINE